MGLTGGLVKSVFSKNRSVGSHDSSVRNYGVDKRRWSAVRSYLCGDEFNSVLADADSASIRSSQATVTQPITEDLNDEDVNSQVTEENRVEEKQSLFSNEDDAAIVIQSSFRRFLARRKDDIVKERECDSSVGTSIEVQTGGSVEIQEEREHRVHQKTRCHGSRFKEDWDDSTVSSNIAQLRIQSRVEATTRRERALAYAFSQQLRVCSKKKTTQPDSSEVSMGWSWLERWMATRSVDTFSIEDQIRKKAFDHVGGEEKESCGSNQVSVGFDHLVITAPDDDKDGRKPRKNRLKATRNVSRRKTVPSYQISAQWMKDTKKDCSKEADKDFNRVLVK